MTDQTVPETLSLKPAPGRRVRHPDGRLMEAAGETVPHDGYWLRRLADEDVTRIPPSRVPAPATTAPEA